MNCPTCQTPIDEHPASRCLDAWVAANILGCKVITLKGWKPSDWEYYACNCRPNDNHGIDDFAAWLKNYSTDISAAWEVVEKIKEQWPQGFYLTYFPKKGWTVAWTQDHMGPIDAIWDEKSAPLAICRAAIKAKINGRT